MTTPSLPKRYEIRSLLGEGGQGRVYRVQDSIRDRELALKLVTPAESQFLRREFDTLRQIRHENLIQVFDWGTLPGGEAYYTMELIEGGDWSRRMGKPQDAGEVRHILTGLLRGLAHLHCHGEIHGDLKPENILLGAGGVVKITDTGMGGGGESGSGKAGTPGYAAPEIWEGAAANVRSDLYSVGVMAYEALTGVHPFAGRTVKEVVSGQLEGWVASPGAHGVRVPADLERVVMRAVERSPGLRQGSGDEFMEGFGVEDRIGEILGGRLVERDREIAAVEQTLKATEPGRPTLINLAGEPGVGGSDLVEEVAARVLHTGGLILELGQRRPVGMQLAELVGEETKGDGLSHDLQSSIWALAQKSQVLIYATRQLDRAAILTVRSLARYLWALSLERGLASRVTIVLSDQGGIDARESFIQEIQVPPASEGTCGEILRATLGTADVQRELISRLHALSGGNVGMLRTILASLIDRRLLVRRDGTWTFREVTQIQALGVEGEANPLEVSWRHLNHEERRAMQALVVFTRPIAASELSGVADPLQLESTLSLLLARGWVRRSHGSWTVASDVIRQTVEKLTPVESQAEVAAAILRALPESVSPDEAIDLQLRFQPSGVDLDRGVEAGERAARQGDHGLAVQRLAACLQRARDASHHARVQTLCLRIASILRQVGDEEGAARYLRSAEYWENGHVQADAAAERELLLGQVSMSKGDLQSGREHLAQAVQLSERAGNRSLLARSHADLAEIDWRHGDEATRHAVIDRLKSILRDGGDAGTDDERAALMYELGAAMVVAGESADSIEILTRGFETASSAYWKMRIANALSSANHYVGNSEAQRKWIDEAWLHAERSQADFFRARILSNRGGMLYNQGRLAEAADQDRLSAVWARRVGSPFEFIAGCAGATICDIHLARYESALAGADSIMTSAKLLSDPQYVARACELEALALFFLGRDVAAEERVREGLAVLSNRGHSEVRPRLDWLLGRILRERGDVHGGKRLLEEAEARLLETRDLEDLWGVQIELDLIEALGIETEPDMTRILDVFGQASNRGLAIVVVPAALAIAEILDRRGLQHGEFRGALAEGLEQAERTGMRELGWRLSYRMGNLALRDGEEKETRTRHTHAVRVLREIAGSLSEPNRKSYLASRHIASALTDMASAA